MVIAPWYFELLDVVKVEITTIWSFRILIQFWTHIFVQLGFYWPRCFSLYSLWVEKKKKQEISKFAWHFPCFFFLFLYKPAWWINNHIWFFLGVPQRTLKVSSTGKKFFQIVFSRPQGFLICAFYLAVKILCEIHRRSGNLLTFNFKNNQ